MLKTKHSVAPNASPGKKLGYWLTPGRWWTVSIQRREVRLLAVYHPYIVDNYHQIYNRTGSALAAWLQR